MSNTNITTTTETTTVTVTENVVEIELNNVGVQGTPGLSGVVSVVSPITNVGSAGSAIVGINQALLSITKSQVSDFTSGTVTSAGTAQQAGTAVYAVNSGTAVFATTAGTSTTISGTITKSQVSDFTSGTVASASTAQQSGTAVYAVNAGTAVYSTTSGTAVYSANSGTALTISGSITKSQVSDFTSGTVAQADNATTSGFATTSGTAVFATTSGTATTISGDITKSQVSDFTSGTVASAGTAQQAGTAVFATNASTAVSVSGSAITQSQVVNLTTDLAGKANLAGGNAFTGAQTVTASTATQVPITLVAASGQTANLLATAGGARIPAAGNYFIAPGITATYSADFTAGASAVTPVTIKGAASQSASILSLQNSAGSITANFTAPVNNVNRLNLGGTDLSATLGITVHASGGVGQIIRGAASQTADLLQIQNSTPTSLFAISSAGLITAKVVSNAANQNRGLLLSNTSDTWQSGLYLKSDASGNPRIALLAPTGALGEAVSIDSAAKVGIGSTAPTAQLDVYSGAAARVGQVIRGAASQSVDLLQLQNSAGTNQFRVDQAGMAIANSLGVAGSPSGISYAYFTTPSASSIPVVIRGAASQSANLQEWQNSAGSILARVHENGDITARVVRSTLAARIQTSDPSVAPMVVTTAASQTANSMEWQNSGGTALATVSAAGVGRFENVGTLNGFGVLGYNASGGHATLVRANAAMTNPGANTGRLYFRDGTNSGTLKLVVRAGAAGAETTILDNIPT
jgi:hypothetical protein